MQKNKQKYTGDENMLLNEAFFAIKDLVGIQFKDIFNES